MRFVSCLLLSSWLPCGVPAMAQQAPLDSLLIANRSEISLVDGRLAGPGADRLVWAAAGAQFFVIAEEHNLAELNELSSALFARLHDLYGYNHVALEQGSIISSWLGDAGRLGNLDAIAELVARYPHAPTFATDEEMAFIARVGAVSTATSNPICGVDQEFGAMHLLDRLADLAPTPEAARAASELSSRAREYEADRSGEVHFVASVLVPGDVERLAALFDAAPGSEAHALIEALRRTNRIYHNYVLSTRGQLTAYENGREREHSMKKRFMDCYGRAQAAGEALPRVLAKLGHWHTYRGIYRANVPTFGNFLSEFATANGMDTFILSTVVIESEDSWRNSGGALAGAAGPGTFTVIDLRSLRPYVHQRRIADLSDRLADLIFQVDAVLVIRGGRTGSYDIVNRHVR